MKQNSSINSKLVTLILLGILASLLPHVAIGVGVIIACKWCYEYGKAYSNSKKDRESE